MHEACVRIGTYGSLEVLKVWVNKVGVRQLCCGIGLKNTPIINFLLGVAVQKEHKELVEYVLSNEDLKKCIDEKFLKDAEGFLNGCGESK